jgi:hypothetical protein
MAARQKIVSGDTEEMVLQKMAEGNTGAHLIAQQCYGGICGPKELSALDDMGIRGADLVLAFFATAYDSLRKSGRHFHFRERIRSLYSAFQNAKDPKAFRNEETTRRRYGVDGRQLGIWIAEFTCDPSETRIQRRDCQADE